MAASYQTGTASSPTNLLQTLVSWLVAQGWTQDASAADGSGWRAHLHKGGLYVNFRAAVNESVWTYSAGAGYGLSLYLGDGYAATGWNVQSGGPKASGTSNTVGVGMELPAGAIQAYHFFDDGGDYVTIVVEKSPGVFVHLGWGPSLIKAGYVDNFPYFFGSSSSYYATLGVTGQSGANLTALCPTAPHQPVSTVHARGFVRVDAGTFTDRWLAITNSAAGTTGGWTGRGARTAADQERRLTPSEYPAWDYVDDRGWQTAYAGALMLPIHLFAGTATARWAPIGYPPGLFYCQAVGHGFAAGSIHVVAGLNFMLFPNFAVWKAA